MSSFEEVTCEHGGLTLVGQMARPSGAGAAPVVMVFPSALGLGEHALDAVKGMAEAGYIGLGIDMYGGGLASSYTDTDATGSRFADLVANPAVLRERALAWLDGARLLPGADPSRIAAIGYCFGGFCVLELARTGADVKAVVSYHGLLKTQIPAAPGTIKAEVVAYCGAKDPYAPAQDIETLRQELTAAGARYQITTFGEAEHSFTDPRAGSAKTPGISYNALAARMAWSGTLTLFAAAL